MDQAQPAIQTAVIDKSDCVQYTAGLGTPCVKWAPYGSFLISVNGAANACAVAFTAPDRPDSKYYETAGLSFIGPTDWECRVHIDDSLAAKGRELMIARMSHGTLVAEYRFDDGDVVPMKYIVRSRSPN
jgi:hypothetical protein